MSNAILFRMGQGFAGTVSRGAGQSTIEGLNMTAAIAGYGLPVKWSTDGVMGIEAADAAADVYGFLARPFPTQGANASDPLGTAVPPIAGIGDVMRRGWMTVQNNAGTPAKNGAVYVRVVDSGVPAQPIGGIEAAADAGDCVAILGAYFTGAADADGIVEIEFNI